MSGIKCHHCPLDNTYGRTTLSVACRRILGVAFHHRNWTGINRVRQCRAWHAIISLENIPYQTTSGMPCHHRPWETTHSETKSGVAWHHCPREAYVVELRRMCTHGETTSSMEMMSLHLHSTHRLEYVGHGMTHVPWAA
uniref:Uncharacterized protein n=1 Tax=Solanum lycopersicum TaxID=4081 RepID=A0A3Q7JD08_SOLLC